MAAPQRAEFRAPEKMKYAGLLLAACAILVLFSLFLYGYTAHLALPVFDDYCRGSLNPSTEFAPTTPHTGYWTAVAWSYQNWSGRWLAVFAEMLLLHSWNILDFYPLLLVVLLAGYIAASACFFKTLFGDLGWQIAALFWLLYWSSTPGAGDTLFSAVLSIENLGSPMLALMAWGLLESSDTGIRPSKFKQTVAITLAATVGSIHEVSGLCLCLALLFRTAAAWETPRRKLWAVALLAAGCGLAINVLAPGNHVRAGLMFPRTAAGILRGLATDGRAAIRTWLFGDLRLWAATLWLSATIAYRKQEVIAGHHLKKFIAAWFVVIAVAFVFPIAAVADEMALRTFSQVYLVFILGWLLTTALIASVWARQYKPSPLLLQTAASIALVVFCGSVAFDGNAAKALSDIRTGDAVKWHRQYADRIAQLRAAARSRPFLSIPAITAAPTLLSTPRDSQDVHYAHNLCMEWFYRIPDISVRPGPIRKYVDSSMSSSGSLENNVSLPASRDLHHQVFASGMSNRKTSMPLALGKTR